MKNIFSLVFLLVSINCFSQGGYIKVNNSYGTISNRASVDSTLFFPTGSGAPSLRGYNLRKGAVYLDSTAFRLWIFNPSTSLWDSVHIGAAGSSGSSWLTTGNTGIDTSVNWLGTNDANDLKIVTNGVRRFTVNTNGALGIGAPADYGTSGYVLQTNGSSGSPGWVDLSGVYATKALDNLASVAINTSLLPGTSASINLGSVAKNWKNIYLAGTTSSSDGIIYRSGQTFIHDYVASGTNGDNLFIGAAAGGAFSLSGSGINGSYNVGLGASALRYNTTGYKNTALGTYSQQSNTTGVNNTTIGQNALTSNTTGYNNTVGGVRAAAFGNGHNQVGWGVDALSRGNTASFNVGVGTDALYNVWNGLYNVAVGDSTLWVDSTGYYNVAIGARAGYGLGDTYPKFATRHDSLATFLGAYATRDSSISGDVALNNITAIGYNAKVYASNQVVIGNSNVTSTLLKGNVGIGTNSPSYPVHILSGSGGAAIDFPGGTAAGFQSTLGDLYIRNANGANAYIGTFSSQFVKFDGTNAGVIIGSGSFGTAAPAGGLLTTGSVGIGGTVAASAALTVTSTTKGFLPPRMTTTERTSISSPAEGLCVYDLTLHKLYVYDGTTWQAAW